MVFKSEVPKDRLVKFNELEVDWAKTTAWGDGGYYGRLWLNVQGREPQGLVPQADYSRVREEISCKLVEMVDHQGRLMNNICYKPEEIYKEVRNVASDLMIYFGNLHWRSVGSLGHPQIYTFENDTGPDDANHAQEGLIIYYDPKKKLGGKQLNGLQLMDVAPTILNLLELPTPGDMQGKVISV